MSDIKERIKERRFVLNLTLLEVANRLGVKEATVQRYESGEIKNIKYDTITRLSEILECSPAYLMGWEDAQKKLATENDDKLKLEELLKAPYMKNICETLLQISPEGRKIILAQIGAIKNLEEDTKK